jgi:hypothetical protein
MKHAPHSIAVTMTLFAGLAIPVQLAAQEQKMPSSQKVQHYKLKILGTLGGSGSAAQGINQQRPAS